MIETMLSSRLAFGSIVACAISMLGACDDFQPCAVPGTAEVCACAPGAQGARVCDAEHTWSQCDCSGAIPLPNQVMPVGGSGGAGGAGGTGGSAGSGGAGTGGMGGSGGMTPPVDGGDDDGGTDPIDAGGMGGIGGMAGEGGMGGVAPETPYGACMNNGDCRPTAECSITPSFPTDATVCAPKCVDISDCPVPEDTYEAMVMCVAGFCRIDCTPVLFAALLTCPTGMTCIAPLFGQSYCHDDGM